MCKAHHVSFGKQWGPISCRRLGVQVLHVVKVIGRKTLVRISRIVHAMSLGDDVSELILRLGSFLNV
jgi:hypothetical protein